MTNRGFSRFPKGYWELWVSIQTPLSQVVCRRSSGVSWRAVSHRTRLLSASCRCRCFDPAVVAFSPAAVAVRMCSGARQEQPSGVQAVFALHMNIPDCERFLVGVPGNRAMSRKQLAERSAGSGVCFCLPAERTLQIRTSQTASALPPPTGTTKAMATREACVDAWLRTTARSRGRIPTPAPNSIFHGAL